MNIELVYGDAQQQTLLTLIIAAHSCVGDALQQVFPADLVAQLAVGIFGQRVTVDKLVHPGDRIEIYRSLSVDPKQARRLLAYTQQKSIKSSRRGRGRRYKLKTVTPIL